MAGQPKVVVGAQEHDLAPRRRDDLEDPRRLVARVPERVPLAARLEDHVARLRVDDLLAELRAGAAAFPSLGRRTHAAIACMPTPFRSMSCLSIPRPGS